MRAVVPGCGMFFGGWFVPDSPASLVERGHVEEGRAILEYIRGTKDVNAEFDDRE